MNGLLIFDKRNDGGHIKKDFIKHLQYWKKKDIKLFALCLDKKDTLVLKKLGINSKYVIGGRVAIFLNILVEFLIRSLKNYDFLIYLTSKPPLLTLLFSKFIKFIIIPTEIKKTRILWKFLRKIKSKNIYLITFESSKYTLLKKLGFLSKNILSFKRPIRFKKRGSTKYKKVIVYAISSGSQLEACLSSARLLNRRELGWRFVLFVNRRLKKLVSSKDLSLGDGKNPKTIFLDKFDEEKITGYKDAFLCVAPGKMEKLDEIGMYMLFNQVPVLSKVDSEISDLVKKYNCGEIISETDNISEKVLSILKDKDRYKKYQDNCIKLRNNYSPLQAAEESYSLIESIR